MSKLAEQMHEVNPIPEIPFLNYSLIPGRNNTPQWLEAAFNYCLRIYGEIALVIETGEFPVMQVPRRPSAEECKGDDRDFVLLEYREVVKQWVIRSNDMDTKKFQVYGVLIGQLSKESKARLKQVATWEQIDKSKCPRALIRAIRESHLTTETGFLLKDKYTVRTEYYKCEQKPGDSTVAFKQEFDHKLKQFKAVANPEEIPNDADQAIDFIKRLDKARYGQLQVDLDNNAALGIGAYPADLQKAYTVVSQYKMTDAYVVPTSTEPAGKVFATVSKDEGGQDDDQSETRGRKKTSTRKKDSTKAQEDGTVEVTQSDKQKKRKDCKVCKSTNHWTGDCPELEDIVQSRRAGKAASGTDVQGEHVGMHMGSGGLSATDFVVF
jgi:hypothetical protein